MILSLLVTILKALSAHLQLFLEGITDIVYTLNYTLFNRCFFYVSFAF